MDLIVTFNWKGRLPAPAQSNRKTLIGLFSIKIECVLGREQHPPSSAILLKNWFEYCLPIITWPNLTWRWQETWNHWNPSLWMKKSLCWFGGRADWARIDGWDPTGRSGLAELLGGKPTQEDNINGSGAIREQSKTKFRTKPDKYSEGYVYRTQVRLLPCIVTPSVMFVES